MRKTLFGIMLTLLLIGMLALTFNIQPVKASGPIYIRADGSVVPDTAPISTVDNVTYTFTDNINASIVVERDNIVVDGAGYTLQGLGGAESQGIALFGRSNITIRNIEIKAFTYGIYVQESSSNAIIRNNLTSNERGILLEQSSTNNTIAGNDVKGNVRGIQILDSSNNNIYNNNIERNHSGGILLSSSNNNCIDQNNITDNTYDWGIAVSKSSNNRISGNNITHNYIGVTLSSQSSNNTVAQNQIKHNDEGVRVDESSSNNRISGDNITDNWLGINFNRCSNNNSLYGNNITNNMFGIWIWDASNNNNVRGNTIANNDYGMWIWDSSTNHIYHNNFLNNTNHVYTEVSANFWDNGSEGNCWSNYTGVDSNSDGIGDSSHTVDTNNTDHYPLVGMVSEFTVWEDKPYIITIISNSTICNFNWAYLLNITSGTWEKKDLWCSALGPDDTVGFCRIMIPRAFMAGPYNVYVYGGEVNATELPISNNTHAFLYFTYTHPTIIAIIPEFPAFLILPLFMITTLLAVLVHKRNHGP